MCDILLSEQRFEDTLVASWMYPMLWGWAGRRWNPHLGKRVAGQETRWPTVSNVGILARKPLGHRR